MASRIALVTGGTRGIGHAICIALRDAGYRVAAVYHGNDAAAQAFKHETSIPVFKWDVGDFAACASGVAAAERELGPIDVLVNNAGIVRDAPLHKMSLEQWSSVLTTNLGSMFNMCRQVIGALQFRWEVFNVTNTQRFDPLTISDLSLGTDPFLGGNPNSDFGRYTSTQTPLNETKAGRVMQFALRYSF